MEIKEYLKELVATPHTIIDREYIGTKRMINRVIGHQQKRREKYVQ